ncbi:PTS sugar transporter subunit IIC [Erysipelothrix larvae]|nr:PTS sugar transporter subunit IIC [Erysipelothrix larvae]
MSIFRHKPNEYLNKILGGVATGIVVALIPNAILGQVFSVLYKSTNMDIFQTLWEVVYAIQFTVPLVIGALIGLQFGYNGIQSACLSAATFIGSGVVTYQVADNYWKIAGTGDLFNVMFTAFFAVILIDLFKDKLGSLTVVLLPILGGALPGFIGVLILPYVSSITSQIGTLINTFTNMQVILMCVLIAISFSIIIITPISTVAIGLAVGLNGLSAGAAAIGVGACAIMLVVGSIRANNEKGVTLAVFLGAMKMMIPNLVKHPIICLPIITTSAISGLVASLFNIAGTAQSSGFGIVGLVGPLAAFEAGVSNGTSSLLQLGIVCLCFFIVPVVSALFSDMLYRKVFKLYDASVFENKGGM